MNFPIRVYYEDTDAGGVVYHANYICFFERARTEYLRQVGFSQQQLLAGSFAFVVKKLEIDYKIPARLDDLLRVETVVTELKKATIVFQQQLWRDDICLSEAKVTVASVDLTKMKPVAIPDDIRQALQAV
ncbi:tol-pal system-associated acyl-CoA thioesterase [Actinobacillus equuli subsp. haemolyticus]|uniref:Tol-pal system-associated acyl-CoA thioesterase n=1 Tax=Actinobacillus equuli subsp. equuli TaxID=202947 RepID=A0A9X4G0U2_ACTEU|nr:tol-pal system-associated acyl-CoA thioesterase [Actinobacillus equuli]MDE8033729.1 tol-pal system-associated acyl-CoA thioesterase [Actinobacillus equuli subsp. equuli]MDG4948208.1 tol-pal system-associated acyl-CoA thioesterase [Actinobacillus equuli subsp. haemolyticus]MDG4952534.1 tol-pal system-associated acyl-CoA thioesterase [Actinobacillus equuli subsp. equuli]WGE43280.1 tol-pal system-associated acyl-CoA thioesterase [Actinobacillus equuli subsp. haemolyticus]WGE49678.1 tol-pal sys